MAQSKPRIKLAGGNWFGIELAKVYNNIPPGTRDKEIAYELLDNISDIDYHLEGEIQIEEIQRTQPEISNLIQYCDELISTGKPEGLGNLTTGEYYKIKVAGTTTWSDFGASANTVGTEFRFSRNPDATFDPSSRVERLEPRYRMNIFLTKATDVYKVLKDMATTFLGIIYWLDNQITVVPDLPSDSVYNFSKSTFFSNLIFG